MRFAFIIVCLLVSISSASTNNIVKVWVNNRTYTMPRPEPNSVRVFWSHGKQYIVTHEGETKEIVPKKEAKIIPIYYKVKEQK